jgi:ABC-2 type transport system permease protein
MSTSSTSSAIRVFLNTLYGYRIAILGWGLGVGAIMFFTLTQVHTLFADPLTRRELVTVAKDFAFFGEPVDVTSPGGYVLYKYGVFLEMVALWGVLAGGRLLRDTEPFGGSLPPLSRPQVVARLAALGTALLLIGLLIGVLTGFGGIQGGAAFSFGDALLLGLDTSLLAAVFAAIAFVIYHYTGDSARAASVTGLLLVLALVIDGIHNVNVMPGFETLAHVSPVFYFTLSKPVIPSYGTDPVALLVLAGWIAGSLVLLGPAARHRERQQRDQMREWQLDKAIASLADTNAELHLLAEYIADLFKRSNRSSGRQNIALNVVFYLLSTTYFAAFVLSFFNVRLTP